MMFFWFVADNVAYRLKYGHWMWPEISFSAWNRRGHGGGFYKGGLRLRLNGGFYGH